MGMWTPAQGWNQRADRIPTTTSSAGVTLTGHATPLSETTAWTELIASVAADAVGILITLGATAAGNTSALVDIAIGAAGSEQLLISNLAGGYSGGWGIGNETPKHYYFPLYIASGTRLAGRVHYAATASETVECALWLIGGRRHEARFVGSKVTTYGAVTASARGTLVTAGNNIYGSTAQLAASTADPIKAMQVGIQGGSDATLTNYRGYLKILAGTTILLDDLAWYVASNEWITAVQTNLLLSHSSLNWPAALDLGAQTQVNGTTNVVHDCILYGVS